MHDCVPPWWNRPSLMDGKQLSLALLAERLDISNDEYYQGTSGTKARIKLGPTTVLHAPAVQRFTKRCERQAAGGQRRACRQRRRQKQRHGQSETERAGRGSEPVARVGRYRLLPAHAEWRVFACAIELWGGWDDSEMLRFGWVGGKRELERACGR